MCWRSMSLYDNKGTYKAIGAVRKENASGLKIREAIGLSLMVLQRKRGSIIIGH